MKFGETFSGFLHGDQEWFLHKYSHVEYKRLKKVLKACRSLRDSDSNEQDESNEGEANSGENQLCQCDIFPASTGHSLHRNTERPPRTSCLTANRPPGPIYISVVLMSHFLTSTFALDFNYEEDHANNKAPAREKTEELKTERNNRRSGIEFGFEKLKNPRNTNELEKETKIWKKSERSNIRAPTREGPVVCEGLSRYPVDSRRSPLRREGCGETRSRKP